MGFGLHQLPHPEQLTNTVDLMLQSATRDSSYITYNFRCCHHHHLSIQSLIIKPPREIGVGSHPLLLETPLYLDRFCNSSAAERRNIRKNLLKRLAD